MKEQIKCNLEYSNKYCNLDEVIPDIEQAVTTLINGSGVGSENLGWLRLPEEYSKDEFSRIVEVGKEIREKAEVFIVIGIGGSYLGARAGIEMQKGLFHNNLSRSKQGDPDIYFAGTNLDGRYLKELLAIIDEKSVYINIISKSGTTLEPAVASRVIINELKKRYSDDELKKRIFVTTDESKGALKKLADEKEYETFIIPNNIGGRYSVLTAVGLLPMAVAGIDIKQMMRGARDAMELYEEPYGKNQCYQYVATRVALYRAKYKIEVLTNYRSSWNYFSEWWKQLFGESEGKEKKGLYPSSMNFTTDLHSLGQYVQEGPRHLFETLLSINSTEDNIITVPENKDNYDGLNYLSGKSFKTLNKAAENGTIQAHMEGGVPQVIITIPEENAYYLGQLFYFFEKACAVSAYALGVNPFNQPGVEAYKKNMLNLLKKEK